MYYTTENEKYYYDITTETKQNGVSCVVCFKNFIQPTVNDKFNKNKIEKMEKNVCDMLKKSVEDSGILSNKCIIDFDCTKNNLKNGKWSRLKVDLYLMSKLITEDEIIGELSKTCENIGDYIENFASSNDFLITYSSDI